MPPKSSKASTAITAQTAVLASPFFSNFPDFTPNPTGSISDDFRRLAQHRNWKNGSKTWKKQWKIYTNQEYDHLIGKSLSGLQDWQRLCEEDGLVEVFALIRKCKMALSKVYVNIVNILDCRRTGEKVKTFKNSRKLGEYTKRNNKVFSRDLAKQDKLLRILLKVLV